MAAFYVNTGTKRVYVTGKQTLSLTDGNGLVRQFVFPDIRVVESGAIISLSDAEIATLTAGTHLEPLPPT